jgi:atlastin
LKNKEIWLGEPEEPLKGFTWRSGTKRDTTGIIMWSDVFLHTSETTGEKLGIILMDTQGLFDNETSPADNSRIFALGTLISSVQILNLFSIIQEDQLQYLQFATEFARFAARDNQDVSSKPFQNLLFLIRYVL